MLSETGPTLSMTTYGCVFKQHISLEAIAGARSTFKSSAFVDDEELYNQPTNGLKRLMKRGLEIQLVENFDRIRSTIHFSNWLMISTGLTQQETTITSIQSGG